MRSATVRELKNKASDLLRQAAREDIVITSRGRPVACLIGLHPDDIEIRPRSRRADYSDPKFRQKALQRLARIWKLKPEQGKKWISQLRHDDVLYGDPGR
jgi:prevent-host-death family protein